MRRRPRRASIIACSRRADHLISPRTRRSASSCATSCCRCASAPTRTRKTISSACTSTSAPRLAPADPYSLVVFPYALTSDGILMIAAQEDIALIETLAERIAALVLAHARIGAVTVRVEKLDVGSGTVGVEIRRERPAETA